MYYGARDIILLAIVTMNKEGFVFCFTNSLIFVVEEEGYDGNTWNHLAIPKILRGARILDLSMCVPTRRFSLLQDMGSDLQPWISIVQYFLENKVTHARR